jgi:3-oxoadipate enol-lactonase
MGIAHEVNGSGEPVLLVAGLGQSGIRRWHRVVKLLSADYEVVTVDNRGIGRSGPCSEPFTVADMAQDALDVMTALGHEAFFLAGHSMGGMIAQEIVRLAPARVRGAVLFSTSPGGANAVAPQAGLDALRPEPGRPTWAKLTGPGFAEAHPEIIEEETQISIEVATPPQMYMLQLQAIGQFAGAESLRTCGVPFLVVHGDHDPLVPYENGVRLARKLGVELVTYEGAGHMIECERPAEMVADMRRHFSAVRVAR